MQDIASVNIMSICHKVYRLCATFGYVKGMRSCRRHIIGASDRYCYILCRRCAAGTTVIIKRNRIDYRYRLAGCKKLRQVVVYGKRPVNRTIVITMLRDRHRVRERI